MAKKDEISKEGMLAIFNGGQAASSELETPTPEQTDDTKIIYRKPKAAAPRGERKTRRVFSLIRPSTYDVLERTAYQRGVSVNEMINIIIDQYLNNEPNI